MIAFYFSELLFKVKYEQNKKIILLRSTVCFIGHYSTQSWANICNRLYFDSYWRWPFTVSFKLTSPHGSRQVTGSLREPPSHHQIWEKFYQRTTHQAWLSSSIATHCPFSSPLVHSSSSGASSNPTPIGPYLPFGSVSHFRYSI